MFPDSLILRQLWMRWRTRARRTMMETVCPAAPDHLLGFNPSTDFILDEPTEADTSRSHQVYRWDDLDQPQATASILEDIAQGIERRARRERLPDCEKWDDGLIPPHPTHKDPGIWRVQVRVCSSFICCSHLSKSFFPAYISICSAILSLKLRCYRWDASVTSC